MKRLLFLTILSALLFTSCTNFSEVDIKNIKLNKFNLVNTSRADVTFEYLIDNPTNSSLIIASAEGFITKEGVNFAQLGLMKPDTIASRSVTSNLVAIKVDMLDPVSLLSMGLNLSSWRIEDFNLDAKITIKTSSGYKKVFKFKNVPLEHLVNRL
ncbi:MAG: hypothetical protein WCX48_07950 [Bacteroidales bacterium]